LSLEHSESWVGKTTNVIPSVILQLIFFILSWNICFDLSESYQLQRLHFTQKFYNGYQTWRCLHPTRLFQKFDGPYRWPRYYYTSQFIPSLSHLYALIPRHKVLWDGGDGPLNQASNFLWKAETELISLCDSDISVRTFHFRTVSIYPR